MENVFEIKNLCKNYPEFSLKDISFSAPKGYIMGFVGQNGSGKTTTIRAMLGMLKPDSGEIKIFGLDSAEDSTVIKQDIGVVFDEMCFAEHLNVIQIGKQLEGFFNNWNDKKYRELIDRFGLPLKKKVGDFSKGMKMKFMVVVSLSHDAKLLILDEPTSGLDPVARDELLDILGEYISDSERSILFSTHITSDLEHIADYVTILNNGEIFYSGTKDDLMERYLVIKGDEQSLSPQVREKCVGFHSYKNGFEGMIENQYADKLSPEIVYEQASIDEILVYIAKESKNERNS